MRKLLVTAALIGVGVLIAGNSAWGKSSGTSAQKLAERYRIDNIEKTWHKAASRKNVDLMMTLWAPKATFTIAGKTYKGRAAIRQVFAQAAPFQPQNHWESDTPRTRSASRSTATGDALLRVPLHRRGHPEGGGRSGRGSGRPEDQRQVADHEGDRVVGDAEAVGQERST